MALNLADVMDQVATALEAVPGLRVFAFPPLSAQPPFAFVNMPETIDYDSSMGRGTDRFTIEVFVGVSNQVDRSARDAIAAFAAGSGPTSLKAAIESSIGASIRVTRATFSTIQLSAGAYAGLVLTLDVVT